MTAPDVHVGDKVRVSYVHEGVVAKDGGVLYIPSSLTPGARVYLNGATKPTSVEVLERAVPKVGDFVKGTELDQLPDGSVVLDTAQGSCVYQRIFDVWRCPHKSGGVIIESCDYRVLYVPEDGAE